MVQNTSFTPISELGEFGLIDRLKATLGQNAATVLKGIGDDAAVYTVSEDRVQVVTTDMLVEGVHFDRTFHPMRYLGFKAISVNASDVCAMNALPKYATVALGIPHNLSVEMLQELYAGMARACKLYGMDLIGGDTTASKQLVISITAIGEAQKEEIAYRSGAKVGDLLCVTGDVGAAYAGLKLLLEEKKHFEKTGERQLDLTEYEYLIQRSLAPTARLDMVRNWRENGVLPSSAIDISDGLASELQHLCRQSNVGADLILGKIPIELVTREAAEFFSEDPETFALYGGDDYELLFTISEDQAIVLDENLYRIIGRITEPEDGIQLILEDGGSMPLEGQGFTHF